MQQYRERGTIHNIIDEASGAMVPPPWNQIVKFTVSEAGMAGSYPNQIERYQDGSWERADSEVIVESAVSLTVNGELWLTFRCTPVNLEALAAGFLFNEGVIQEKEEIASIHVCDHEDNIDVWINHRTEKPTTWQRTSGCTGGVTAVESIYHLQPVDVHSHEEVITPEQVNQQVMLLFKAQQLYRLTGGVHTSVLSDGTVVVASSEDIGRHNTLDKIAGLCLLQDLHPERRILMTTGRISSEMIQKAGRIGSSIVISRTSPSSLSILLAEQMGILLIGYARESRFSIYSHPERVLKNGRAKIDLPTAHAPQPARKEVL
jgi:FdhD protein